MKKIIITFILTIFISLNINLVNSDYIEDLLNLKTGAQEIKFKFIKLEDPKLKNINNEKKFKKLKYLNPKIQRAILSQYKAGKFGYYQTLGLVDNYNNFLYYTNEYFHSLKDKEIYGDTKEVKQNIYKSFINMKEFYIKFAWLAKQKNMN